MSEPAPEATPEGGPDREHQDAHGDDVVGGETVAPGVPDTEKGRHPRPGGDDADDYDEAWGGEH